MAIKPPDQGFIFWPVGTGDSTTIRVADTIYVQLDLRHMAKAEGDDDPAWPVIDELIDILPTLDRTPYLSVFALTHPDLDHCQGFEELKARGRVREQVPKPCSVNLHSMATRLPAPFSSTSTLVGLGSFKQRTSFSKSSVHLVRGWRVDIKLRIPLDKPPIAPDPTPSSKDGLRSADKHPGELLPDEGSPEPAAGRRGSKSQEGCVVTAGQNGDRNGAARPLWVTGLSPPDSWRSLRQPGYPQLHRVRHPQRRVWGYDRKSGVSDFRLSKVCSFRLPLTSPLGASGNSARAAPRARPSWPRNKAGSSPRQRRRSRPRSSANPPANQGTRESDGADLINGLVSPFTAGRAFTGRKSWVRRRPSAAVDTRTSMPLASNAATSAPLA